MKLGLALLSCISLSPALWTVHLGDPEVGGGQQKLQQREKGTEVSTPTGSGVGAPKIQRDPLLLEVIPSSWGLAKSSLA